jgi:type IV pilus assembly protein PilC
MPLFEYQGRRYEDGIRVAGEREAQNRRNLAALLRKNGIVPIHIVERRSLPGPTRLGRQTGGWKDVALFTRYLSVMLDAGLPLVQCLAILAAQQRATGFRNILVQVKADVESGASLTDAMRRHPATFGSLVISLVAAGEAGGALDVILRRLSEYLEKAVKLKRSVLSASLYPCVVLLLASIIVFLVMIWLVPVFVSLFQGLDAPLPLPTRVVMTISQWTARNGIPLGLLLMISLLGGLPIGRSKRGRSAADRVLLRLPVIGKISSKIAMARIALALSTMLQSGVPLLEGLEITANTAGNSVIAGAIRRVKREVESGRHLVEPMEETGIFPAMMTQMVAVGEKTGALDQMLEKLAAFYEEEADSAIGNLMTLVEPAMIVFLGVVVGTIVVSMYLPIFGLIGHLAG